jgi:hypothetical protein
MVGKFDQKQEMSADKRTITTCGPITWQLPQDEGATITRVNVEFEDVHGRKCNGHSKDESFAQGTHHEWMFTMRNNGMTPGPATARGEFVTTKGKVPWKDEVELVLPS